MREPQQKTIRGVLYEVTPLPASQGLRLLTRITRIAGPVLAAAPSLASLGEGSLQMLGSFVAHVSEDDMEHVRATLAAGTRVLPASGAPVSLAGSVAFDAHFGTDYGAMLEWMMAALETNYGSFFGGLKRAPASGPVASTAQTG